VLTGDVAAHGSVVETATIKQVTPDVRAPLFVVVSILSILSFGVLSTFRGWCSPFPSTLLNGVTRLRRAGTFSAAEPGHCEERDA
jgi:hypothetical protein